MPAERAQDQLARLLEHEGNLLREGRLDRLSTIAETKERLMSDVSKGPVDPETLLEISRLTRRNAALLDAAGSGLRAAHRRLRALREASGPIKSYGAQGQEKAIGCHDPNVSRKA